MAQSSLLKAPSSLLLLVIIAACAGPVVLYPGQRDVSRIMENLSLVSSQETWVRVHEESRGGTRRHDAARWGEGVRAWLMPSLNGRPRANKPPMLVWVHLLAWWDLSPATATPIDLAVRARWVAAGMALLTVAGVFWIGRSLGRRPRRDGVGFDEREDELRLAVLAALACGACYFLQKYGRTAAYDIHLTAWCTLCVAAAVSMVGAVGPTDKIRGLRGWGGWGGWLLAGGCLAAGTLTKGPLALAFGGIPAGLAVVFLVEGGALSRERLRYVPGLAVMMLLGTLPWAAWSWYAMESGAVTAGRLEQEFAAGRDVSKPVWYYVTALPLLLPWVVWFGVAVGVMWDGVAERGLTPPAKRRWAFVLAWLGVGVVGMSIPGAKSERYVLPLLPAAALLVGLLFVWWGSAKPQAAHGAGLRKVGVGHAVVLGAVSLVIGPLLAGQGWAVERGWIEEVVVEPIPWWLAVPWSLALMGISGLMGWAFTLSASPRRDGVGFLPGVMAGAVALAAWWLVCSAVVWPAYDAKPDEGQRTITEAAKVNALAGNRPIVALRSVSGEHPNVSDDEEFLFYSRRIMPLIRPEAVPALAERDPGAWVATERSAADAAVMEAAGYEPVTNYRPSPDVGRRLWRPSSDRVIE